MRNINLKKEIVVGLLIIFLISSGINAIGFQVNNKEINDSMSGNSWSEIKYIEKEFYFSGLEIVEHNEYWIVRVYETNHNRITLFNRDPSKPVIPVNISTFELVFGSKILDITYENSTPEIYDLPGQLAFGKASYDTIGDETIKISRDNRIYESSDPYPADWITYHTGGGLSFGEHTTFLGLRVYPVRYFPLENQIHFISTISVNISYIEPLEPLINDSNTLDLLILTPSKFKKQLEPLVCHKKKFGVRTKLVTLDYVYENIWYGRDKAEKIKLFIKEAIEDSGIKYVLLVGGIKGQTNVWNLPVRLSRVIPTSEQEYPEQSFISDLYYADIYDGEGMFSSWDSNNDNIYSLWNETFKEEMDIYPDVYLGRLPCRNTFEVRIMVNKIINYEKEKVSDKDWFNNLILVAGDNYDDSYYNTSNNEGELISEKAITLMPGFNPVRVYARSPDGDDVNKDTVNNAMNGGAGFAYFCGHGSIRSWNTHYPPNGTEWAGGYKNRDMIYLKNREKLPITVVGGCHNGEFDVTMWRLIDGFLNNGFKYFRLNPQAGRFWWGEWIPNCWAWWLTSKIGGGAIATIANTGLGTHGDGDLDNNTIADYLEILDGWMELRFLELYGMENKDILGENHGETLTGYLHRFMGDDTKMDVKMVQQWVLFGDPSMKIGGYE